MDQDLQGKIGRFTLPEIFQLIANSQKTGTLGIQKDDDIVMIYFKKGKIIYGYGPRKTYHLGELLREKEEITLDQLNDAVNTQAKTQSSKRLGQILIEKGYIQKRNLEQVVKNQVEELIYSLLSWESGSFKFYENQYPTEEEITVNISVENAILEGFRRIDELNHIKEALPDLKTILAIAPTSSERRTDFSLHSDEWNLLALVDSRRTIEEIAGVSKLPRIEALQKLGALKLAGLVTVADKKTPEKDNLTAMIERVTGLLEEYLADKSKNTSTERTTLQFLRNSTPVNPKETT
ncbi:MAG: DUF4388 domain-containing protein [candidate division Zixibacteria bacterium]|nr:DUF4388 domain-containing protein [candidate division Zixibacteria bacterium]